MRPVLNGSVLQIQFDWLMCNAEVDQSGTVRCKRSNVEIRSRVEHRYRLAASGADAPFVSENLLDGFGDANMISFNAFWCSGCDIPALPERVPRRAVIMLKDSVPQ